MQGCVLAWHAVFVLAGVVQSLPCLVSSTQLTRLRPSGVPAYKQICSIVCFTLNLHVFWLGIQPCDGGTGVVAQGMGRACKLALGDGKCVVCCSMWVMTLICG